MFCEKLKMSLFNIMWLISALVLAGIFSYWTKKAWQKYDSEPVSNNLELRYGDDNLGNITMPAITICRHWFWAGDYHKEDYCAFDVNLGPIYKHAIDYIEKINNVTKFVDDIKYDNTVEGKIHL